MIDVSHGIHPNSGLGYFLLIFGVLFTSGIIFIFINLNEDSAEDRRRKELQLKHSQEKISRLYPKKNSNN